MAAESADSAKPSMVTTSTKKEIRRTSKLQSTLVKELEKSIATAGKPNGVADSAAAASSLNAKNDTAARYHYAWKQLATKEKCRQMLRDDCSVCCIAI